MGGARGGRLGMRGMVGDVGEVEMWRMGLGVGREREGVGEGGRVREEADGEGHVYLTGLAAGGGGLEVGVEPRRLGCWDDSMRMEKWGGGGQGGSGGRRFPGEVGGRYAQ